MDADKIKEILTDFKEEIKLDIGKLSVRLNKVELCANNSDRDKPKTAGRVVDSLGAVGDNFQNVGSAECAFPSSENLREFDSIKESLQRVKLPNELRLIDSKAGIPKEAQPTLAIISKSARFVETALKIVSDSEFEVDDLFTVLKANINFLQSEYTALIVEGQFDQETAKLYKCLEKNSAMFSDEALGHLRVAAEISTAKNRARRGTGFQTRGDRGFRSFRGGARGDRGGFSRRPFGYDNDFKARNPDFPRY